MKVKIRDLTIEQYMKYDCNKYDDNCEGCIFKKVNCNKYDKYNRINYNKNLYREEFLNQEIEIKCEILTKEEKGYLEFVLKPFCKNIRSVKKEECHSYSCTPKEYIIVYIEGLDSMIFPLFEKGTMYKGMELYKSYTPEELGLWENKNES